MRYADMRGMVAERAVLLDKKRLGKRQKARLADLSTLLTEAETYHQPPATPPCVNTGERADWQGNVYEEHKARPITMRMQRRANRFGRGEIQYMRSRIQRMTRRQRTGGVR